jgi:undecaprenyl diphosphate synthase
MMFMQIPEHVGVIIDGNRRWARDHGLKPWEGHKVGRQVAEDFLDWSLDLGIKNVSIYVLSTENLSRSPIELKEIYHLVMGLLDIFDKKQPLLDKYDVSIRFLGNLEKLPSHVRKVIGKIMEKTAKHQKRFVNIMIAYGSHYEFVNVVKKIVEKAMKFGKVKVTPKEIEKNLLVKAPVNLMIRTGGMQRLSGFMMWQAAYAEIYFTKTLWPDFTKKEYLKAIKWYNSQKRNFGM